MADCRSSFFAPDTRTASPWIEPAGGNKVRQKIVLRRGLPEELAKRVQKLIRDEFPKVKSQIQGDAVRVSGAKKDDLQSAIQLVRKSVTDLPLQFINFRD